MVSGNALSGMKAITAYCGAIGLPRTEASVIQLKLSYGFPMEKILGIWESDKEAITAWRRRYVAGEIAPQPSAPDKRSPVAKRPVARRRP